MNSSSISLLFINVKGKF